ncbi:phosphotransferase [Kribbella sp.]|uniref:phosphotransferase n=1 Tax=Kribbella sp. TaxID=1871183 RepID=UPI002D6E7909|nr:phosphotransferase [Kribbella sp.]HZX04602.1 phosphotransferase [Kribbella sp.]
MDELVALLDDNNRVVGSAPRSVMRRDNLRHSATGVVVRNSAGDIYVHRRTPTKDVYPSRYDFAAGGVVAAGEEPFHAVVRELEEELGIAGVELTRLPEGDYADENTRYHAYLYTCMWDGPVRHQPEEVAWGAWMSPAELVAKFDEWEFMPDTVGLLGSYVRNLTIGEGWDSHAWAEGPWLHRAPRRPEIWPRLLAEVTLLPWLAPQLPLPVPAPELTVDGVRHLMLPGEPLTGGDVEAGRALGAFLKALHSVDPTEAVVYGALDAATATAAKTAELEEFRQQIVPLLPAEVQDQAGQLLDRVAQVRTSLIHCDFGPEHILTVDGRITGIIDWTDAVIGDPALDLCWPLNGAPEAVRTGVLEVYRPTPDLVERSKDWARLSPWYGVHRGLRLDLADEVRNGLREIRDRL